MTRYSLYVCHEGKEEFVQTARNLVDLQGPKNKLLRWIAEMGIEVVPRNATVHIKGDGEPLFEARLGTPRLNWKTCEPTGI
jgi:hypothetical protein